MKIRKLPIYILAIINIAIVMGLWLSGFAGWLNPNSWHWLSLIGYAFPAFLLATLASLVVWVFIKKRYLIIPFIGLIVAYVPVTLYCPINFQSNNDEATNDGATNAQPDTEKLSGSKNVSSSLTIVSYNTCNWGCDKAAPDSTTNDDTKKQMMADFFRSTNADIIALQECGTYLDALNDAYAYRDSLKNHNAGGCNVMIYSRYPILRRENLNIDSKGNVAGAFWLNINGTETIVINTHLETMGFSMAERQRFGDMVHGNEQLRDSVKQTSHTIFGKILHASKIRAMQADIIARFIEAHQGMPIIVAGDFNDIPQSYTYHTISRNLTDCYRQCALGPGFTYRHYTMRARIDNILCTQHFTPLAAHVDNTITISDHQPIVASLVHNSVDK